MRATPGLLDRPAGIVVKSLAIALVFMGVKYAVHAGGYEFVETLPLLTALMGGVVFTLAILLSGVMADFKESERIVGELASHLQRLHVDAAIIAKGPALAEIRRNVHLAARAVHANLRGGVAVRMREIKRPIGDLDACLAAAAAAGAPTSPLRTMQVHVGNVVRIVDRLETIVETTFMQAGYYYAGAVVVVAAGALTVTQIRPFEQGLLLYGFALFLLSGLFMLVADLDNPFSGHVRISLRQLEKVEHELGDQAEREGKGG